MRKANNLNMKFWQSCENGVTALNIKQLHECGNTACFAGYIAISKRFKKEGGVISGAGCPYFKDGIGHGAIGEFLNISNILSERLVHGDFCDSTDIKYSKFYNKPWEEVTPEDVIEKLELILKGELK